MRPTPSLLPLRAGLLPVLLPSVFLLPACLDRLGDNRAAKPSAETTDTSPLDPNADDTAQDDTARDDTAQDDTAGGTGNETTADDTASDDTASDSNAVVAAWPTLSDFWDGDAEWAEDPTFSPPAELQHHAETTTVTAFG